MDSQSAERSYTDWINLATEISSIPSKLKVSAGSTAESRDRVRDFVVEGLLRAWCDASVESLSREWRAASVNACDRSILVVTVDLSEARVLAQATLPE